MRAVVVVLSVAAATASAGAQAQNRAGIVVQYDGDRVVTFCVRFDEPSISGLDLLSRAGLRPVAEVGGLGAAVCSLDGQGCAYPSQPCFCQCQGSRCSYWNYLHLVDGSWRYSPIGAAAYTVRDGAVEAWAWGDQLTPPIYTIDQICAESPTPPAAPVVAQTTPTPAASPTPASSDTPAPTETWQPTQTPGPLASPGLPRPSRTPAPTTIVVAVRSTDESTSVAQVDAGGYVLVAVVTLVLGGWLLASRARRS